jgi:hypothetical protein
VLPYLPSKSDDIIKTVVAVMKRMRIPFVVSAAVENCPDHHDKILLYQSATTIDFSYKEDTSY